MAAAAPNSSVLIFGTGPSLGGSEEVDVPVLNGVFARLAREAAPGGVGE